MNTFQPLQPRNLGNVVDTPVPSEVERLREVIRTLNSSNKQLAEACVNLAEIIKGYSKNDIELTRMGSIQRAAREMLK
jgi:SpoVK/Ycf46/Vps4 family AAA+-type ATPase